jgi:hypothetical protein
MQKYNIKYPYPEVTNIKIDVKGKPQCYFMNILGVEHETEQIKEVS